jgi:hypothetical protein
MSSRGNGAQGEFDNYALEYYIVYGTLVHSVMYPVVSTLIYSRAGGFSSWFGILQPRDFVSFSLFSDLNNPCTFYN